MVQEMAPSGEPGGEDGLVKRACEMHGHRAVGFLLFVKSNLGDDAYKELIKTVQEIVKRRCAPTSIASYSCTEGGITVKKCEEILSEVFVGQTHVLKGFHHFLEGRGLLHDHDSQQGLQRAVSFLEKVKASPKISHEDYDDFLAALIQSMVTKTDVEVESIYRKVKRAMHQCPEFIKTFETYLPDSLRVPLANEQSCRSPKTSPTDKAVLCFTPDAGNRMETTNIKYNVAQAGYPHDQDHEETEYNFRQRHTQGMPDSFETPSKGNGESLHAEEHGGDKTDPLPDWSPSKENELPPKCLTLKSSYRTKLGQSIFNDTLVSATSGREDCFKFRTKNHYEENIFKCEDDMFESDMLLQRYKATADFIGNLQDHVDSNMKIQEHLTPLLAEAREINMARLNNGDKHLSSACNNQSSLVSENVLEDTDLHIHKDIDSIVRCASKSCPSEQKPVMIWTKLVQPFVSINCQLPESNGTVAPDEGCEHCGLGKNFLRSIPDSSFANNIPLSSKRGGYLVTTSNKSACKHDACQTEIEEGEFIPDDGDIQLGSMLGPGNGAASYDVAAPSEDGSSFRCPGSSICDHGNKSEVHHESRVGCDVEMGSLAYSKRTAEPHDVKGGIPCCSLAVFLRLYQILYERLLLANSLSGGSGTCDVYAGFKEVLFKLLTGSTNSSNFEKYCLTFLGPRSYVLFTLNEVIGRVIKQLCKICPGAEDNSLIQPHEKVRGPDPSKDLSHHQNARSSPARPTNGSLEQDHHEEGENGSKQPLDDTVKPMQNHFQRRKKRKLETGEASISQPGAHNSNS
ncbi:hypothetical protein BAE44_0010172 [Dichanthelium oligosanthes]|uniref:Histone deacetylase interacting domain-containing protein n=1 Tax=Dichanthelium oligosanthes TaxID=888268 RepID=A0A1E5VUP4_9POAL|nr:hypothetical protein BAE44_0010172 [Dichanthelium oligosanthes]